MDISSFSACRFRGIPRRTAGLIEPRGKRSGFTLIELVVVVAIISIMLSIVVVSAPTNRREFLLSTSQEQLRTLITRSRALAINSVTGGQIPAGQVCGYGTKIDASKSAATIYYACGTATQTNFTPVTTTYYSGTLNQISLDKSLSFMQDANIFFLPPGPAVYINGSAGQSSVTAYVTAGNGEQRGVEVNSAGLIDLVMR